MPSLGPPPTDSQIAGSEGKVGPAWVRWFQQFWDGVRPVQASFTWDPGNLADGDGETSAAVSVAGAGFGDSVIVGAPYDLQGILCAGYVSAAGAVKVRLQNETGGAIDLASGSWTVRLLRNS